MFFGHCHRTRFRDSFCLASVFEMTVYLLTYLLEAEHRKNGTS